MAAGFGDEVIFGVGVAAGFGDKVIFGVGVGADVGADVGVGVGVGVTGFPFTNLISTPIDPFGIPKE